MVSTCVLNVWARYVHFYVRVATWPLCSIPLAGDANIVSPVRRVYAAPHSTARTRLGNLQFSICHVDIVH
jgi:hypothetical protein